MRRIFTPVMLGWLVFSHLDVSHGDEPGYRKEVLVQQPTQLDWVFAVANQSVVDPPADWLEGYESTKQRYELFVPDRPNTSKAAKKKSPAVLKTSERELLPAVLFISAGNQPAGWNAWKAVCEKQRIVFASPYDAGNNTPMPRRVRLVLDVLDDLRRRQGIDPDRTYLAGFSGGGRVACGIAFALPELFGGVIPVCAAGDLRDGPCHWARCTGHVEAR